MKKLLPSILLLSFILLLSLLFYQGKLTQKSSLTPQAALVVKTFPEGLAVFLDDQELGVTPLTRQGILAGEHVLRLGNFEKKINLEKNTQTQLELKISPPGDLIAGFQISYQKLPVFAQSNNLFIFVDEPGALMTLKGADFEKRGSAAILDLEHLEPGHYRLKIEKAGFSTQEFPIEVLANFLVSVEVKLTQDLLFGLEKLDEEIVIEPANEVGEKLEWVSSLEWRKKPLELAKTTINLEDWQNLSFFKLPYNSWEWELTQKSQVLKYLDLLEFQAQTDMGFFGLPFCYLFTPEGQVYEGLGLFNFDYSGIGQLNLDKGDCPVVFLVSDQNKEVSLPIKDQAKKLANFLAQEKPLSAKLLSQTNLLELSPGEEREILLEFQNTSSLIWQKTVGERVLLAALRRGESSEFYHPNWLSAWQITYFNEPQVTLLAKATFTFKIKAPFYPGQFQLELVLIDEQTQNAVENSNVKLDWVVKKEGAAVIEILKTPTGFLNIREEPLVEAKLIGTAYEGENYLVLERLSGWYKVLLHDGNKGFVSGQYIKEK